MTSEDQELGPRRAPEALEPAGAEEGSEPFDPLGAITAFVEVERRRPVPRSRMTEIES